MLTMHSNVPPTGNFSLHDLAHTYRLGNKVAHPQDCLPTARLRRESFSSPQKVTLPCNMQTGPGGSRLSPLGKATCASPGNLRMWWHVACVVFESKKRGRGHVKQCFPAGLLDSAAINCMQSSMAQVPAHHADKHFSLGDLFEPFAYCRCRAQPAWQTPGKEKIEKKVYSPPWVHPSAGVEAKSTFGARRNLETRVPAHWNQMICTQLQIMVKRPTTCVAPLRLLC